MLPLVDSPVDFAIYVSEITKQRDGTIMNQRVFWSGLCDNDDQQTVIGFDELILEKNTPNEVNQSSRVATQVFKDPNNIIKLLDLAFPTESATDLATAAFDIFMMFPFNSVVMDACFSNDDILVKVFELLHSYVTKPVEQSVLNAITFKGKQDFISALSSFVFAGFKKDERLLFTVELFNRNKELFDKWVACICNQKTQEVFLFFLTSYQTRNSETTVKISDLCSSRSLMRNFVRKVAGITSSSGIDAAHSGGVANTGAAKVTVEDRMDEYSKLASSHETLSYTEVEACSTVLATILRCNVPYLCDQIFEHYRLILDRYLFISTYSKEIAAIDGALIMLKMCGQVVIHMLRYLVVRSIALHYRQFKTNPPQLSDDFFKERGEYFNNAISHFIYVTENKVKCTYIEEPTGENSTKSPHTTEHERNGTNEAKTVANTKDYTLPKYANDEIDKFEEKYFPIFIQIVNTLTEALIFVSRPVSKEPATQQGNEGAADADKTLQVASYLYLLYLSHAIGVIRSAKNVTKLFSNSGDIDEAQSDPSARKAALMDETSIREFMWSDMYTDAAFSMERVMNYNQGGTYNTKQIQMIISPFLLYSYLVRSNKISSILHIMKAYKKNTVIQSVGVQIISGIIELGISLSAKNTSLLECTIARLCSFYLNNKSKDSSPQSSTKKSENLISYDIAIKSIFRETMRFCTKANSTLLMAIKYDYYAVDMDCLGEYVSDASNPDLVPRTLDEFHKSKNVKYSRAYELLCNHNTFTECVKELLNETDLKKPLSTENP